MSLHSKGGKATYADLATMYEAVDHLRKTSDRGFTMNPTAIDDSTLVITYADSSWANVENYASQRGCLILFAEAKATDVATPACLVDWKSSRSGRVCRSTGSRSKRSRFVSGSLHLLQFDDLRDPSENSLLQDLQAIANAASDGLQVTIRQYSC